MDDVKEVFLAVIDGEDPTEWQPWGSILPGVFRNLRVQKLGLPEYFKNYRFAVKLQTPATLFDREGEEWTRFVGAVVDGDRAGGAEAETIIRRFKQFCVILRRLDEAWFKNLGFYVAVVCSRRTDDLGDFEHRLRESARDLFAHDLSEKEGLIQIDSVEDGDSEKLFYMLRIYNKQLILKDFYG